MLKSFLNSRRTHASTSSTAGDADSPPDYGSALSERPWGFCHPDAKQEGQVCLFYRVYSEDGGMVPKTTVGGDNPYIGCVDAQLVAPPHTVASIKRCLCKIEKIADHSATELYASNAQLTPLDDGEHITILSGTGPGSTLKEPLALVREIKEPEFNLKIRMISAWLYVPTYPEWLGYQIDEILYTDHVAHYQTYTPGSYYPVYRARNAAGQEGWVIISASHYCYFA